MNDKNNNDGPLNGLINSTVGVLLNQSENEPKNKTETENYDDIVSASLSGEGKQKISSIDGHSDSF